MKTTKLMVKLFLIISLLASIAVADEGQMGGGNFGDDGQMGGGNITCNVEEDKNCQDSDGEGLTDSILDFVKDYLAQLIS